MDEYKIPMTDEELLTRRTSLQLSQGRLARVLGYAPNTVWSWENDNAKIPFLAALVVRLMCDDEKIKDKILKITEGGK